MNILPVKPNINRNPSFAHYGLNNFAENAKLGYSKETYLLREDFKWKNFVNFIGGKYRAAKKVNLVNHACSAGLEAYTLLMQLIETLGKTSQKFMPIIARDIDISALEHAKSGCFDLCNMELGYAMRNFKDTFNNNFIIKKQTTEDNHPGPWDNAAIATCKTNLRGNIDFQQSDIFNDKELINKDNTILFFRNVWQYLGEEKVSKLAHFLASNMKTSSLLVIGDYDWLYGINLLLDDYGFKKTNIEYVYEPPSTPAKQNIEKFPLIKCWGRKMSPEELRICS